MSLPPKPPSTERSHAGSGGGYLDGASGEPLHPHARETLLAALDLGYADPRRLHGAARRSRLLLDNAREAAAEALGLRADEVTFVSSGTQAVHLGLLGLLPPAVGGRPGDAGPGAIWRSAVEHSSVAHALAWSGRTTAVLPVTSTGRLDLAALPTDGDAGLDSGLDAGLESGGRATIVALQSANPEVGTRQPVDELAAALPEARIFCDLAASVGQEPLPQGWVVGAASAHKWGGPAGVGLLLVRRGAGWRAPFPVDDRTDPRAVGFENVPAALAASASLQAVMADLAQSGARRRALTTHLRQRLAALPDVVVLGEPSERLPHVVAFSCLYVDGEVLVSELDRRGYAVHSGSACVSSDAVGPSHVLEAMGVLTHGNVRVSLPLQASALPDEDGLDRFVAAVELVLTEQRAVLGL